MLDAYREARYLARILSITLVDLKTSEREEIQNYMRDELARLMQAAHPKPEAGGSQLAPADRVADLEPVC